MMAVIKNKLHIKFAIPCPCCQRKEPIGFLGGGASKRFFCKECCIEFIIKSQTIKFIVVDTNGIMLK